MRRYVWSRNLMNEEVMARDGPQRQRRKREREIGRIVLVTHHAKRMCRITLSSVVCPSVPYFPTVSHKRQDFRKKVTQHDMCVLICSINFVWNISHTKESWASYYHKYRHVFITSTCYSCRVLMKLEFSRPDFQKIFKYKIWWKSVQWEPNCSGLTNRQTQK